MSARYLGGIVSKDPLTLNPAAGNAANGVFTLNQYMQAVKNATWPGFDPYFKQTTLLLHGNGTNGAQNNTFLDSSTNNFTITRNGNTTQGTFSPFSVGAGEWSNYFDGTGDWLGIAYNAAFLMGTSTDFCMEGWIYPTETPANADAIYSSYPDTTNNNWIIWFQSGKLGVYQYPAASFTTGAFQSTTTIPINTWTHFAFTRSGSDFRLFINGVQEATLNASVNFGAASKPLEIGRYGNNTTSNFNGYISNLRHVIGSAVYTSNFTPTGPLTNITNTSLLTCQSNRFVDNSTANSGTGFTITPNGDVRVTPFSPFAPTAAYSAGTNGGSGYFDGNTDYLTYSPSTSNQFGTGSFTVEAWYYPLTAPTGGNASFIYDARTASVTSTWILGCRLNGTGTGNLLGWYDGSTVLQGSALNLNAWNHVVYVRDSGTNTGSLFLNGTRTATQTDSTNYSSTGATATIGSRYTIEQYLNGYLANLRLVKGTAVYDPTQTTLNIPTAPLTNITNTSLLLNFTNAGIIDNTGKNNLETVGNAQIDTTTKKFGDGSMEFDGNGDYLVPSGDTNNFVFGTGDFTIEFWLRLSSTQTSIIYDQRAAGTQGLYPEIYVSSNSIRYYTNSADRITGSTLSNNQWYHIALVRSSGSTKLYVDGTQSGSTYADTNNYINGTNRPIIGAGAFTAGQDPMTGFIDDLRITKGVARYTANFTPQTSQWQDQ